MSGPSSVGLDLTQHRPVRASVGSSGVASDWLGQVPPTVVLPAVRREPMVIGQQADLHRRGIGLPWPPEAQAPSVRRGAPRVPLVAAWARLAGPPGFAGRTTWGRTRDNVFTWTVRSELDGQGRHDVSLGRSPSQIIAESAAHWLDADTSEHALVVPDRFDESAQQALLERITTFLIPRPIAVALHWCRTDPDALRLAASALAHNEPAGRLLVVTTAMDSWEVASIELRAWRTEHGRHLVPVRRRPTEGCELPWVGAAFLHALAVQRAGGGGAWRALFDEKQHQAASPDDPADLERARTAMGQCLIDGWSPDSRLIIDGLEVWSDLLEAAPGAVTRERVKSVVAEVAAHSLEGCDPHNSLACVIDGTCSQVSLSAANSLGGFLGRVAGVPNVTIGDSTWAARGAAFAADANAHGLPPYLDAIVPVELYCLGEDENRDLAEKWKRLVDRDIVEAGTEYVSSQPITGLSIAAGERRLELTLQRAAPRKDPEFRRVGMDISRPSSKDEPVLINVRLRTGQGHAQVEVRSRTPGIFEGRLDWRTMTDCSRPKPPPLGYIAGVARVVHDRELWHAARFVIDEALNGLPKADNRRIHLLINAVRSHAGKTPLADARLKLRGAPLANDPLLHFGLFPSDGDWSTLDTATRATASKLRSMVEAVALDAKRPKTTRDAAHRLLGWMYLACPTSIVGRSRREIADPSRLALDTMGLCFEKPRDIGALIHRIAQELATRRVGVNHWLRALKNIVRFRHHSLSPEAVERRDVDAVFRAVLEILEEQRAAGKYAQIFGNCVWALLGLLKRRRYEPNFVGHGTRLFELADDVIGKCIASRTRADGRRVSDHKRELLEHTRRFLRIEATGEDLAGVLRLVEDDDAADDDDA